MFFITSQFQVKVAGSDLLWLIHRTFHRTKLVDWLANKLRIRLGDEKTFRDLGSGLLLSGCALVEDKKF